MTRLRVHCMSMSTDGYVAGPHQDVKNPIGLGGSALHEWMFTTRTLRRMNGQAAGETGIDDDYVAAGFEGIGATIMGRNMFGPIRGPWPDDNWRGWWGDTPPYGHQVFVLTHHSRPSLPMDGGTVFHFVTDGIESAYAQAVDAAGDLDVRLGGGAETVRRYLFAGLVDSLHLAIAPVVLDQGEALLDDVNLAQLGYALARLEPGPSVTHIVVEKAGGGSQ